MEESFNPVAQSRANYYTPGCPVQFVKVELLKGEQSGENAVCLTFKNISPSTVTGLEITFRCKNAHGEMLCEDTFAYEDISAAYGELFGMDEAVFVSEQAIGSVDVILDVVHSGKKTMQATDIKRTRLPAPKRLSREQCHALEKRMGREELKYIPQILENGWYCACGAFHPNEEDTVYCSECGCDRILLQNAMSSLLEAKPAAGESAPAVPVDEPTRIVGGGEAAQPSEGSMAESQDHTRVVSAAKTEPNGSTRVGNGAKMSAEDYTRVVGGTKPAQEEYTRAFDEQPRKRRMDKNAADHFVENYHSDELEDEEENPRDLRAENIIRWVPAATALACALIALGGFFYCQVIL